MNFRDPITKYSSIGGYLFNISFLKTAFRPEFYLYDIRQTGPSELTSRWCMRMFPPSPLPTLWRPTMTFTGESIYGIDPATGKRPPAGASIW